MATISAQMYDSGLENLKKAALSVKVRSFLSGQNGDVDPSDLDNPELSLDLQSLIDDPNFEVNDGLFPELLHDKLSSGGKIDYSQLTLRGHPQLSLSHQHLQQQQQQQLQQLQQQQQQQNYPRGNPLAYMPQPVHGGSSFINNTNNNQGNPGSNGSSNGTANSSPSSSPAQNHHGHHNNNNHNNNNSSGGVKEEPLDHRLDFNANTVSSSSDPGYSSYSSSNNLTSPSSTSSSSSGGGSGGGSGSGYSPNAYIQQHHSSLAPTTLPNNSDGLVIKNGLSFNPQSSKGMMGHPGQHNSHHGHGGHHGHHGSLSKKMKNVDKASDEYKRRRERNNVAVRKSREKAKMRSRETEERVKILAKENERLQKKIDLLTEELTFLRSFFSNVGGLPEQIHREFNKHLETFQHHHIQNGIQFPSFASFKSMQ